MKTTLKTFARQTAAIAAAVLLMTSSPASAAPRQLQELSRVHCGDALRCSTQRCNVVERDGTTRSMTDAERRWLAVYYAKNCGPACVLSRINGPRRLCPTMGVAQ